jgi:hypothetical protein
VEVEDEKVVNLYRLYLWAGAPSAQLASIVEGKTGRTTGYGCWMYVPQTVAL